MNGKKKGGIVKPLFILLLLALLAVVAMIIWKQWEYGASVDFYSGLRGV